MFVLVGEETDLDFKLWGLEYKRKKKKKKEKRKKIHIDTL